MCCAQRAFFQRASCSLFSEDDEGQQLTDVIAFDGLELHPRALVVDVGGSLMEVVGPSVAECDTRGATPFLVVKIKPSMMLWSMPVQCKGAEDQAAIKETVEALNRHGNPELIVRSDNEPAMLAFRDAVSKELEERFGARAIAQAPPKCDPASAGVVENAIKHVKEKNAGDRDK